MPGEIITRADARAKGLKRYRTGKPCPDGHDAERFVSNSTCVVCDSLNHRAVNEAHREDGRLA